MHATLAPPPAVDDATRRQFLGLIAAAGLLTACGSDSDSPSADAGPQVRPFEHDFGTTQIPQSPERIVCADPVSFAVLAGFDVRPAGAFIDSVSGTDYLAAAKAGVPDISTGAGEVNLEAVAALDPDLVITLGGFDDFREQYEELAALAPTVAPAYNYVTLDQTLAHWRGVADAAGATDRGEQAIADLQGRIDTLAADLGRRMQDKPVSVLRVGTEGFYSVRFGTLESSLMKAVGIPRPPNQQDPEEFAFDLSLERVGEIDAFAVFVYVDVDADVERAALEANPLWNRLEAVAAGRVFFVEAGVWNGLDPIAAGLVLDDIDRHLGPLV